MINENHWIMTINTEPNMKKSLKRYAQFWIGGCAVAMIVGAIVSVITTDDLMLDMGYRILILEIIAGVFNGAIAYVSASAGLLGFFLLIYRGLDIKYKGFAFMRGFSSVFVFYVCWIGIDVLLEKSPQTVAGIYKDIHAEIISIPITILTILVLGVILGLVTKFVSDRFLADDRG